MKSFKFVALRRFAVFLSILMIVEVNQTLSA